MQGNGFSSPSYIFADIHLDPESKIVAASGQEIHLPHRPFEVLSFLVENHGRVVSRKELLDRFWDGHDVYDDALRKCIGAIRKALKDEGKPPRFIETRYGGGYRFVADVQVRSDQPNSGSNDRRASNRSDGPISAAPKALRAPKRPIFRILAGVIAISTAIVLLSYGYDLARHADVRSVAIVDANSPLLPIRSIAVMPLKNLTGDSRNDYFSDGVTESVITELSKTNELTVISRTSSFAFKDQNVDSREIGERLGAEALLEGAVQKSGENISVRVRLVNSGDGSVIWTSSDFQRPITSAYDLQNVIACDLARELRTRLCGIENLPKTRDGLAYQEYLLGRFEWNKRTAEGIRKSIEHYRKATELDPNYSLAYSGLSESYVQGIWHVPFASGEALPKGKEAALKAVELDPGLAEAHAALLSVYSLEWKWKEAEVAYRRAIEINPFLARSYHVQAFCLMINGRYDESISEIQRAERIDPLNLVIASDKGNLLFAASRIDEAFTQWAKTLALEPNFLMAYEHRATANELLGNEPAAVDDIVRTMQIKGDPPRTIAAFRDSAEKLGLRGVRETELRGLLRRRSRGEAISDVAVAMYQTLLGQNDAAFASLEAAYRNHSPEIVLIASPQFWRLRSDPRFNALLNRIGVTG